MSSPSTQLSAPTTMGIYEPYHQISTWGNVFKDNLLADTSASIAEADARLKAKPDYDSHESMDTLMSVQDENRSGDKTQRRLAQNREAARKSRLRKKAYVQQLEVSCLKLAQLEQELERAKQGVYIGGAIDVSHLGSCATVNPGVATFEMKYSHWVDEQQRQNNQLRSALQAQVTDIELRILVESILNHYYSLFRIKADAAKADVFYLMSGMWRTSAERFFLWISGFRPSELLNVLKPNFKALSDQQALDISNLRQSSQQAEDALSQGMEKLHQNLAQSIGTDPLAAGSYNSQMADAMEKLEALESFVGQADHLRQQTLQRMSRILNTKQAALGLLALGDYFHRLRAFSSLWAARPHEPA